MAKPGMWAAFKVGSYTDPFNGDVGGNALIYAPEFTWNIGLQYEAAIRRNTASLSACVSDGARRHFGAGGGGARP